MKIIDDTVFEALKQFRATCDSQQEMADKLGLSRGQISRILNRRTVSFENQTWARISPLIEPYIKMGESCLPCSSCPKKDVCILQALFDNILSIPPENREAWYRELNEYVLRNRAKYMAINK